MWKHYQSCNTIGILFLIQTGFTYWLFSPVFLIETMAFHLFSIIKASQATENSVSHIKVSSSFHAIFQKLFLICFITIGKKSKHEFAKQLSHNIWPAKRAYVSYIALLVERRKFVTTVSTTLSGTGGEEAWISSSYLPYFERYIDL